MPAKDIEVKRATARRCYRKNRERHLWLKSVRLQARKAFPVPKECSVVGCTNIGERHHPDYSKPLDIVWLCKKHHYIEHLTNRVCSIEGCDNKHEAKGFCRKHYRLYRISKGVAPSTA